MDDDNLNETNFTDLDLNQEPPIDLHPPLAAVTRIGPLLNELDVFRGRIEERIRFLEGVTSQESQQNWLPQYNPVVTTPYSYQVIDYADEEREVLDGVNNPSSGNVETTVEKGRGCKRNSSHLVTNALEINSDIKEAEKEGGSFYDCNICLDLAKDPILTCCGHLFCWACFYQVSDIDTNSKECPVCKGGVSNSSVVPIYGNGESEKVHETESGLKIPPRPKARRVESVRQQLQGATGLSHVPVLEALRRIHMGIGAPGHQPQQEDDQNVILNFSVEPQGEPNTETEGGGNHRRMHQVSRVLSESAASLSSLSSALSNAERLVEDLESVINNRFPPSDTDASANRVQNLFMHRIPSDLEFLPPESSRNPTVLFPTTGPSQLIDESDYIPVLSMPATAQRGNPVALYSLRRRNIPSRTPNGESRDTRAARRRRLN